MHGRADEVDQRMRLIRCAAITGTVLLSFACGGSKAPSSPTPVNLTLKGTVSDPGGDRQSVLGVSIPPDLISATIDVSGGSATILVTFAPGTLEPTFTLFSVLLDTDENPATGNSGIGADGTTFGWDYSVAGVNPQGSTTAQIARALGPGQPGQVTPVGTATVTFPAADQARVTVPLSVLGGDDGRMSFKVICQQWIAGPNTTGVLDWMPDVGQAAGLVR
jgi:hypothetical protein